MHDIPDAVLSTSGSKQVNRVDKGLIPFIVYRYAYRLSSVGAWRRSHFLMTPEHAKTRYGEGNYEIIDGTGEVRYSKAEDAAHPPSKAVQTQYPPVNMLILYRFKVR